MNDRVTEGALLISVHLPPEIGPISLALSPPSAKLERVTTQVVVVVVVLRELFSLVTSAICVRIRGHRSEVTKMVYHMTQAFRLLLRSYHSEFVGTV